MSWENKYIEDSNNEGFLNASAEQWWKTIYDNPVTNPYGTFMWLKRGGKTAQDVAEDKRDADKIAELESVNKELTDK